MKAAPLDITPPDWAGDVPTLPAVSESLRAVRASGGDHADRLEREADELETRAHRLRLEAFHARNLHRLANKHAPQEQSR